MTAARPRPDDLSGADDERWMRRALDLAERARGRTSPNPAVGCVLVRDGQAVGEGFTEPAGQAHAEIVALAAAGGQAAGATAYVTLEPCSHVGRTGPCAAALVDAGLTRVVAATADPGSPGGADRLREAGIQVEVGLLGRQARRQNEAFFHSVETGRPFVIVKAAVSLDGRIAAADGTSQWLTGESARQRAHALRADVDAVLVGSGTVLADDPALTCRLPGWDGPQPLRAILDGRARSDPALRALSPEGSAVVFTGPDANPDSVKALASAGIEIAQVAAGLRGGVDLDQVLAALAERGLRSVLVEGGAGVITGFLGAGLCDKLVLHVAPLLLGDEGRPLLERGAVATLGSARRLRFDAIERADEDVILTLYPEGD